LHIKFEVIFLSICTYGIVNLKLLIVFVHLELAARTSLGLNRSGEPCAFVLGNLAIGERRQGRYGEYCHRYDQSHEQVPPVDVCSERFALTTRMPATGKRSANPGSPPVESVGVQVGKSLISA
jgi:hypothetical protein